VVAGGLLVLYQVTLKAQPPKAARHIVARRFGVLTESYKPQAASATKRTQLKGKIKI